MLDGDADWFRRQLNAIEYGDKRTDAEKDRHRFEAEVLRLLTVALIPERKILAAFVQRRDTKPLTDEEKETIRDLEWSDYSHALIEDEIGKSYKRTYSGDYVAVSEGGGALILEWTLGKRTYSCRFKNKRCARDAVREIVRLARRGFAR